MLTMFDDEDSVFAAMRAGARGYVVKGAEQEEIGPGDPGSRIRRGDLLPGRGAAGAALLCGSAPAADPFPELTRGSGRSLTLLAAAMPNSMIATRLGLSPKTVANHLSSIFTKLQVADRAQAILRAREPGSGSVTTVCSSALCCRAAGNRPEFASLTPPKSPHSACLTRECCVFREVSLTVRISCRCGL